MALILNKSIFYHIPKTGGQWVGAVLRNLGLVRAYYGEELPRGSLNLVKEHVPPTKARKKVVGKLKSFAFIRNPITWYQSFWRYKHHAFPGRPWDEPYSRYTDNNFNEFMKKIMDIYPGFLTDIYKEFNGVDYLGRQENLRGDLIAVLTKIGEDFSMDMVAMLPEVGATPHNLPCDYELPILKRMKKLEKWIFKKYYPESL